MASSFSSSLMVSSSSSPRNWRYNVFTSFHGPDTRIKFLSHLRQQFKYNGITMFDDNGIERSQTIGPALKTAIEESRIAILLLSKNYASSSWCLDELLEIMKCKKEIGQIVMTVFYEVDPSDVRRQTGDFGNAFNKTCDGKTEEQRQNWSQALTDVGNIAGYDFKTCPNEAERIEEIARDVSDKLNVTPCKDFGDKVGLENHLRKIESLLDLDNAEVKIVGISGPAGIGKSTIARALQNRLRSKFQYNCFGDNLWEYYKIGNGGQGVTLRLHEQLLSKLFNQNGMQITHLGVIQERLHDKKVLIILDDVESVDQLEALANIMWFGAGSRVIVTTENKDILQQHDIPDIYHVGFPSKREALMIFCISAFGQSSPPDGFMNLAQEVVSICGNLPLGLRVLGSVLRRKSYANWIDELPRLKNSLDGRIESVLKLGYKSLDEKDQSLFLNIAVFFNYEHVDHVKLMLAKSNLDVRLGLQKLASKYLIHINGSRVVMHRLLQVMARQVMTKQKHGKRQILVDAQEISYVLENASGKGSIVGVSFDVAEINELMISPMAFKSMYNLLFLKIYNNPWHTRKLHVPEDIEFPRHIRLFHWDGYPGKSLPIRFCANLVELNMEKSKFEKLWEGKQPLENLKKMNLWFSSCLRELPDLSNATSLETLNIISCKALVELPSSIANLHQLKELLTHSCTSLEVMPTLTNLTSLDAINMTGCSRLRSFPDLPTNITELQISETAVEETAASLRHCSRLEYVELSENDNLKTFATHLPTSVTYINLHNSGIERMTDCISGLHNLTVLSLSSCKRLASLPELPGSLKFLDADNCISLESVSDPINTPKAEVRFTNCIKLSRQARRAIIQGSFGHKCAVLPGRKVPKEFDCRARGNSLTISGSTFKRFKVCVVMSPDEQYYCKSVKVLCRWKVIGNSVKSGKITFWIYDSPLDCYLAIEHLFIFHISLPFSDSSEVSRKIVLKFSSIDQYVDIIKCGVQYLTDETDGSNNERYGDEDDILDTHESDEASDIEVEDYDSIGTSGYESGEASDTEDDEDRYKSEFGEGFEGFEEKDESIGGMDESEYMERLWKTSVFIASASSSQPDLSAALVEFNMLEQRTIALTDGSVHSNLALPPNYQDSPPPFHPEEFRDHPERAEMLRQSQQFMNYANPNDQSVAGTSSSPLLRDVAMLEKMMKQLSLSG